jgi:hypothetical protein
MFIQFVDTCGSRTALRCESNDDHAFLCSYAHAKILFEERLNQFVISSGNVQRDTFILVHALAVQVPLPRNSTLNPNQLTRRIPLLASFGQYACIIGYSEFRHKRCASL